jgi:hypothetical protein
MMDRLMLEMEYAACRVHTLPNVPEPHLKMNATNLRTGKLILVRVYERMASVIPVDI